MSYLIIFIVVIFLIGALSDAHDNKRAEEFPAEEFQNAKTKYEILEKTFTKKLMPLIYNMKALSIAYEQGLPRLTDVEAANFFSYPQEYIIDENDDLIVNDVNLGNSKENELIKLYYQVEGYKINYNYGFRYDLIKDDLGGRLVISDYDLCGGFTAITDKFSIEDNIKAKHFKSLYNEDALFKELDNINLRSKSAFSKYIDVLPPKFKKLYEDFQNNDYTTEEMKEKLHNLYKESKEEYKNLSNKINKYNKYRNAGNKEEVKELYLGYGENFWQAESNGIRYKHEKEENKKYWGTKFYNTEALDKMGNKEKEYIEKYNLK